MDRLFCILAPPSLALHNGKDPIVLQAGKYAYGIGGTFEVGQDSTGLSKRVPVGRCGILHTLQIPKIRLFKVVNRVDKRISFYKVIAGTKDKDILYETVV